MFEESLLCYDLHFCYHVPDSDEDISEKSTDEDHQRSALEELTDVHFKFEVKEVCLLSGVFEVLYSAPQHN